MFHTIVSAAPLPDSRLRLTYEDGRVVEVDFRPLIARGGAFEPLSRPEVFEQVRIGEHGRYIEWPGELDFCADALRENDVYANMATTAVQ
jgi:hypothetical protein